MPPMRQFYLEKDGPAETQARHPQQANFRKRAEHRLDSTLTLGLQADKDIVIHTRTTPQGPGTEKRPKVPTRSVIIQGERWQRQSA